MYPKSFEYHRAQSVDDALTFLGSHEDAKIIAGGQSLVPMMKLRISTPSSLVDISRLEELRYIREDGGSVKIGALVTHSEIEESELVRKKIPVLSLTASNIGDVQIRDLGTIGGSVCHADPSADYLPTLLVLEASVVLRSAGGARRSVPVGEFIVGPFGTTLHENEILEEVVIPIYSGVGAVSKFARRKADFALVASAALMEAEAGTVKKVRIAIGPQETSAVRLLNVEKQLQGKRFADFAEFAKAVHAGLAQEKLAFPSDLHGSSWYRGEILETILTRTLRDVFERTENHG